MKEILTISSSHYNHSRPCPTPLPLRVSSYLMRRSTTALPRTACKLFSLPAELRIRIYGLAVTFPHSLTFRPAREIVLPASARPESGSTWDHEGEPPGQARKSPDLLRIERVRSPSNEQMNHGRPLHDFMVVRSCKASAAGQQHSRA